jgi:hypothetical protein
MTASGSALRTLLAPVGRHWRSVLVYVVIPLLTGYAVIERVFVGDDCFPVDLGDEPAETFVQVPMAQAQLASGEFLKMNLYNNFGTPILGEPVVYPYAVHALSYVFFRPIVAMVVNKFLLATLSMVVLTLFFSRYFLPLNSALCAFLTFSSPSFLYFFHNHPHQGALFYYGLILLALRWFFDRLSAWRAFCVYAAFLAFLLSVGINGALLGTGFIWAYAVLLGWRKWRALVGAAALWLAAFLAVHPQYLEFFRLAGESARKDLNYQMLTVLPPLRFLKGLFIFDEEVAQATVFYSWPAVLLALGGLTLMFLKRYRLPGSEGAGRRQPPRSAADDAPTESVNDSPGLVRYGRELRILTLWLGLAPFAVIAICRIFPALPTHLPLVKATNISRLLWFSDLFLALAVGLAVDALWRGTPSFRLGMLSAYLDGLLHSKTGVATRYHLGGRVLVGVLVTVCLTQRVSAFLVQANYALCNEKWTRFQPEGFLTIMKPYTRLATLSDPVPWSQDTKANREHILGSAGRSIILNKAFKDYLQRQQLIEPGFGGMTYFFHPSPPAALAPFGIRYCISPEPREELAQLGWIPRAEGSWTDVEGRWTLFENPVPATPFYLVGAKGPEFLQHYRLAGDRMEIELPPLTEARELVATFVAQPGWKASLDGAPTPIRKGEDRFIRVHVEPSQGQPVNPGEPATLAALGRPQRLVLRYEPYTNGYLWACVAVSLGSAVFISRLVRTREDAAA